MSAALLYRASAVILVLFAAGHQFGFRQVDPRWGIDALVNDLKTTRFTVQGWSRTYWDFFAGFGYFVTVLLAFSALLAWQLGGLPLPALHGMPVLLWAFAFCYAGITILTWRHFFKAPLILSVLTTLLLVLGAWSATVG